MRKCPHCGVPLELEVMDGEYVFPFHDDQRSDLPFDDPDRMCPMSFKPLRPELSVRITCTCGRVLKIAATATMLPLHDVPGRSANPVRCLKSRQPIATLTTTK